MKTYLRTQFLWIVAVATLGMATGFLVGVYVAEPWWYPEIVHTKSVIMNKLVKESEARAESQRARAE